MDMKNVGARFIGCMLAVASLVGCKKDKDMQLPRAKNALYYEVGINYQKPNTVLNIVAEVDTGYIQFRTDNANGPWTLRLPEPYSFVNPADTIQKTPQRPLTNVTGFWSNKKTILQFIRGTDTLQLTPGPNAAALFTGDVTGQHVNSYIAPELLNGSKWHLN